MNKRKLRLGLALAPLALAFFAFAQPAQAADYSGTCANISQFDGTGNVTINQATACTLPQAITATGAISITAPSITSNVGAMSGSSITLQSTAGAISTNKALTSTAGPVTLTSTGGLIKGAAVTATAGNLTINSSAALTLTGLARSTTGSVNITAVNNIQTKRLTAGTSLQVTSTAGTVTHNGGTATSSALLASDGALEINSNGTLTITGTTVSTKNNLQLIAISDIEADVVKAGAHLKVKSQSGKVNLKSTVDTNTNGTGGNALIQAFGNVATGTVKTNGTLNGGSKSGMIQIDANTGSATTSPFIIGGSGNANGVNGDLITNTATGGMSDLRYVKHGVSVTNGTPSATGGIQLTSATNIKVLATTSRAGMILLDARMGSLSLPGGTNPITANGSGTTYPAGQIFLLAQSITFGPDAVVTATQGQAAPGSSHGVTIAAQSINYNGPNGLSILADGSGENASFPTYAYLYPQGSVTFNRSNDFQNLTIISDISGVQGTNKPVTVTGAGSSPLLLRADGNDTNVSIRGNGVNLNTGNITLRARGRTNHQVVLNDTVTQDSNGLTFGTTSSIVVIDTRGDSVASGTNAVNGGDIVVNFDQLLLNGATYTLDASGPASGNGGGGTINFGSRLATLLGPNTAVTLKADAATAGSGDAASIAIGKKAIQFFPGPTPITFGAPATAGQYSMSAQGGATGGNGGEIVTSSYQITIATPKAINASANSGNGKGGKITVNSVVQTPVTAGATIEAVGKGNGEGGKVIMPFASTLAGFDYLAVIKVDGGPSALVTTPYGTMAIQGITCGQWKIGTGTGNTVWPFTYWNCVNPTAPMSLESEAGNVADGLINLKTPLGQQKTAIFVMNDVTAYNTMWKDNQPVGSGGVTYNSLLNGTLTTSVYVNVFLNGVREGAVISPYSPLEFRAVVAHEFGHAVDINTGLLSFGAAYNSYVTRDLLNLDYVEDKTVVPSVYRKRLPCAPTPLATGFSTDSPPFSGVTASVIPGSPSVCLGGALNPALTGISPNASNSYVLSSIAGATIGNNSETMAQTFSIQAVGSQGVRPAVEQVYSNSAPSLNNLGSKYFGCVKAWASAQLGGAISTPADPERCSVSEPGYTPFVP